MGRFSTVLPVAAIALGAASAQANDSSAELAAGGLVLTRTDAIRLEAEDLYVSPQEIRVKYRFRNLTATPVSQIVAFPLPDVVVEGPEYNLALPKEDAAEDFLGFATQAGGQAVHAKVEQKVFARDVERTAVLRELGLPLAPYLNDLDKKLDALPPTARRKLVDLGLAVEIREGSDSAQVTRLYPSWTLKTTYYWEQTFPPGELEIEHRYEPSVGVTLGTLIGAGFMDAMLKDASPSEGDRATIADYQGYLKKYCIEDDLISSARQMQRRAGSIGPLTEQRVSYILKTGANWSGPIGQFRLVVDKQYPDNLVSFCGNGVKKTGPTTFEITAKDFTPQQDLSILILTTHMRK